MEGIIYNLLEITLILKSIRYKSHPIRAILLGILNFGCVQIKGDSFWTYFNAVRKEVRSEPYSRTNSW